MPKKHGSATHASILALREESRALRAQNKARAEELVAHIRRNLGLITDAFYEVGTALAELNNNRLFTVLGFENFGNMVEGLHLLGATQATKLVAVATLVPRETAVSLGPEKSYALTRYVRVAPETPSVAAVIQEGTVEGRPLEDVSARELTGITQRLARSQGTAVHPDLREALRLARHAQATLRKKGMAAVRVETRGARGQRLRVEMDVAGLQWLLKQIG